MKCFLLATVIPLGMHGFSSIRLIFGIAFLGILFAALYSQANPLEKAKQEKDRQLLQYSEKLLGAINDFYRKTGRMPWTDDLGAEIGRTPFLFTPATEISVGICGDSKCTKPGEMAILEPMLYPLPRGADRILVGKGAASQDEVYACFIPDSEDLRKKTGSLFRIEGLEKSPFTEIPSCGDNVNWTDDYCFSCSR